MENKIARESKLMRIKNYLENNKDHELKQQIYNIVRAYQEKYTTTRTHILINLSWACDDCIDEIYTIVSNLGFV